MKNNIINIIFNSLFLLLIFIIGSSPYYIAFCAYYEIGKVPYLLYTVIGCVISLFILMFLINK